MNRASITQKMSLIAILLAMAFISSQCQSTLTLQEQHDRQEALTKANPPPVPEEGTGLTKQEQKQTQAELTELGMEFVPYDVAPKPIGGYAELQRKVYYPAVAQQAGIEGTVIVSAYIDETGKVQKTKLMQGVPDTGLDEAAVDVIRKTRFEPAKMQGKNIGVWVSIPIRFKLGDESSTKKTKN